MMVDLSEVTLHTYDRISDPSVPQNLGFNSHVVNAEFHIKVLSEHLQRVGHLDAL